jgi:hypothetical protein
VSTAAWWKLFAIAGAGLNAFAWAIIAIPPQALWYWSVCQMHIGALPQGLTFVGSLGLSIPIVLTFATAAAGNSQLPLAQRIPWTLAVLLAPPLAIPWYWSHFLRRPGLPHP